MCLFFLLIAYALFAMYWAGSQAYYRKAIYRSRILVVTLTLPVVCWWALLGAQTVCNKFGASEDISATVMLAILGVYFVGTVATILWVYLAKADSGGRGFPIELTRKD